MQAFDNLPPIVAILIGALALFWLVLALLVPFMIEGIRQSARKSHEELVDLNEKLDRLTALLTDAAGPSTVAAPHARSNARSNAADTADARVEGVRQAAAEARGRREPTISATEIDEPPRPNRREPIVR